MNSKIQVIYIIFVRHVYTHLNEVEVDRATTTTKKRTKNCVAKTSFRALFIQTRVGHTDTQTSVKKLKFKVINMSK